VGAVEVGAVEVEEVKKEKLAISRCQAKRELDVRVGEVA
jgi:hypothetical protein